jgi:hypothetical protein
MGASRVSEQFKPPTPSLEERVALLERIVLAQSQMIEKQSDNFTKQIGVNTQVIGLIQELLDAAKTR